MKNKMLGILVPVLAGAAVIGTGFSTWYFTNANQSSVNGIATQIALASEISTLKLKSSETVLDTSKTFELSLDSTRDEDAADPKGVNLLYKDGDSDAVVVNDIDVLYTLNAAVGFDLSTRHPVLTVTVTLGGNLPTYVTLNATEWTANGSAVYTKTIEDTNATFNQENTIGVPAFGFQWTEHGEPGSYGAWKATKTALNSATVQIDYSLAWSAAE